MFVVERSAFALYLFRSFLYGLLVAAVYLAGGFVRIIFDRCGRIFSVLLTALYDFSLCLVSTFFAMLLVYSANRGQIRIIAILFFIAGFVLLYLPLRHKIEETEKHLIERIFSKILIPCLDFGRIRIQKVRLNIQQKREFRKCEKYDRNFEKTLEKELDLCLAEGFEKIFGK